MVLVLGFATARSRIFSHRTTAHGPHKITSSAGRRVHFPAADRMVAAPAPPALLPYRSPPSGRLAGGGRAALRGGRRRRVRCPRRAGSPGVPPLECARKAHPVQDAALHHRAHLPP